MAQVAQSAQGRNTRGYRPCKSRNFSFTLNNYTETDIKDICDGKYQYIFQEETGELGTPHLQGMVCFPNAISELSVRRMIPRAHVEVCRKKHALINYCKKGDTRTGRIFSNVESWLNGTTFSTTQPPDPMELLEYIEIDWNDPIWNKLIPGLGL